MQLSAEQFERILSALRSDSPAGGAKDKRRRPRVGLRASITVIEGGSPGKGTRITATIRDISREGIGIQRSSALKAGQRFLVQLPRDDGGPQSILCTVRHCEAVADSAYHIGATFIRVCNVNPREAAQVMNADAAEAQAMSAGAFAENARIRKAILS
jgi:hypothetical protein